MRTRVGLIATDEALARAVEAKVERRLAEFPTAEAARRARRAEGRGLRRDRDASVDGARGRPPGRAAGGAPERERGARRAPARGAAPPGPASDVAGGGVAGGRPDPRGLRLRPVRVPGLEVQRRPSTKPTGTGRAGSAAASMVRVRGATRTGAPPCEGRDGRGGGRGRRRDERVGIREDGIERLPRRAHGRGGRWATMPARAIRPVRRPPDLEDVRPALWPPGDQDRGAGLDPRARGPVHRRDGQVREAQSRGRVVEEPPGVRVGVADGPASPMGHPRAGEVPAGGSGSREGVEGRGHVLHRAPDGPPRRATGRTPSPRPPAGSRGARRRARCGRSGSRPWTPSCGREIRGRGSGRGSARPRSARLRGA